MVATLLEYMKLLASVKLLLKIKTHSILILCVELGSAAFGEGSIVCPYEYCGIQTTCYAATTK